MSTCSQYACPICIILHWCTNNLLARIVVHQRARCSIGNRVVGVTAARPTYYDCTADLGNWRNRDEAQWVYLLKQIIGLVSPLPLFAVPVEPTIDWLFWWLVINNLCLQSCVFDFEWLFFRLVPRTRCPQEWQSC